MGSGGWRRPCADRLARLLTKRRASRQPLDPRIVAEPPDRRTADDVGLEDLLQVCCLDAVVPNVVRVDDDHRTVAAL